MSRHLAEAQPQPIQAHTIKHRSGQAGTAEKNIRVIELVGTLMKSRPSLGGTSTVDARRQIRLAANDNSVDAILLHIDSPGGTVAGTDDLAKEVQAAAKKKPVFAQIEDLGASAAYWIASQADKVFANSPTALVGSIGTLLVVYDFSQQAEKEGIRTLVFATGDLKGAGVAGSKVTDQQADYFQGLVNDAQRQFDLAVQAGRRLNESQFAKAKTGAVFAADEALRLGLLDGIQNLDATLERIASGSLQRRGPRMTNDLDTIRAEERQRLAAIDNATRNLHLDGPFAERAEELRQQAIAGDLTIEQLQAGLLDLIRQSRPAAPLLTGGAKWISSTDHLAAALLAKAGLERLAEKAFGPHVMEQSRPLHAASLVDICREAIRLDGREIPRTRNQIISAAFSGGSIPTALGTASDKVLVAAYLQAPAAWRSFAAVRSTSNFKTHNAIRPTFGGNLSELPEGGGIDHGTLGEDVYTYSVSTYAKQYKIDRRAIINDDASIFSDVIPGLARAAARTLNDLVAFKILENANSFWSNGNNNFLTGGGSALGSAGLSAAIQMLRDMTDAEGNYLDLEPRVLLVPSDLEETARALLNSDFVERSQAPNDREPTGNVHRNIAELVVEPRLGNGVTFGDVTQVGSTTAWYLFSDPSNAAVIVAFLNGQQTPIIEPFGLRDDPDHLALQFRVYHDFGVALGDNRAAIKAAGA
ncbi:MAG: hypothetical protein KatS3mg105_4404 [Gemmatales bacterium]|nr:MAG: hypothetical protein KatS3mg105_4404 [Gemmatales bacterium]